jgi:hypothetical protein
MAPRRLGAGAGASRNDGYLSAAYRELTAPENQSVLRSIAIFGVRVL